MNNKDKNLPMRATPAGERIDTRPMYIEEWLDALPYIDFKKTSQLLNEATRATNDQQIKPAIRLELVELYNRPYQYYIDSQIKAGAQHTLQSIEAVKEQIRVLKKIAVNLALACKISAEETLRKKTLWGQGKPPVKNYYLALNYLSHAMIFSYLEYSPTPKNVWKEINFIYDFAESLSLENSTIILPDSYAMHGITTISQAYKRIVLASLADPHHLLYGAIWEIYEQLSSWVDRVKISAFAPCEEQSSRFVINLDGDSNPIPLGKFNIARAGQRHRLVDASELSELIQTYIRSLESGGRLDKTVVLSPYFCRMILEHLSQVWGSPPKRKNPRKERKGSLDLACGLNPAFYFLNDEQPFSVPVPETAGDEDIDSPDSSMTKVPASSESYRVEKWELVDQSAQGFAVIKNLKPVYNVKVGELVIINTKTQGKKWAIGVIRWLMIRQGEIYKIGVQILSVDTEPVAIKACNGSTQDTRYRCALLVKQGSTGDPSIITTKGIYMKNREVEVYLDNRPIRTKSIQLLESTTGFEQFAISATV